MFKCLGVILDLDKYIFPWPACFIWGGHLKLELSCIWVNTSMLEQYLFCAGFHVK